MPIGATISTLQPTDTGSSIGGMWAIDEQSQPGLFSLQSNTSQGHYAQLVLASDQFPLGDQPVSVTVRYYDLYQLDSSGNPIPGEGFTKTLTFNVKGASQDLSFGHDISVTHNVNDTTDQTTPAITTLSNGNFVIVWSDRDTGEIQAQIYNETGTALGGQLTLASGDAMQPSIVALAGGKFAVVYSANDTWDINYLIADSSGLLTPPQLLGAGEWDNYSRLSMTANASGSELTLTWNLSDWKTIKSATISADGALSTPPTTLRSR